MIFKVNDMMQYDDYITHLEQKNEDVRVFYERKTKDAVSKIDQEIDMLQIQRQDKIDKLARDSKVLNDSMELCQQEIHIIETAIREAEEHIENQERDLFGYQKQIKSFEKSNRNNMAELKQLKNHQAGLLNDKMNLQHRLNDIEKKIEISRNSLQKRKLINRYLMIAISAMVVAIIILIRM